MCQKHAVGPPGQVLYSCLDAFVLDVSDYLGHLIRHLLNASEAFPAEWFLQFWEQVKVWWAQPTLVQRLGKSCIPGLAAVRFRTVPNRKQNFTHTLCSLLSAIIKIAKPPSRHL
jgi:hypothetical protein